jgi:uncharacterized membrane protein YhaH (DUF805 family)
MARGAERVKNGGSGMEWYLMVWKKYADFSGRSRRKEYWMFTLINTVLCIAVEIVAFATFTSTKTSVIGTLIFGLLCAYSLALIVPSLAVTVRRLHDTGKSGWMWLIGLIPLVGGIILLVWLATDSQPGANQYGPNPKLDPQLAMNS